MKKNIFSIAIALCMSAFCLQLSVFAQLGSWSQKVNFGGAGRSNAVGFSIGSYGYIGTGYTGTPQKDFWRYDPSNNSWTQMANFGGTARYAATGFSIGNSGYIGTGSDGTYLKDFWKYDPVGNAWSAIANFGGNARYYAVGFSIGNNGYVGTGMDGSVAYNNFYKYNSLTNTWVSKAAFGGSVRADCFAFAVNDKGYIGCGRNFTGSTFYNTFYQYDTTANTWTPKANFGGVAREGVSAFVIGNYGYAGTGSISSFATQYTDFYKYDPVGNAWTAIAPFSGTQRTNAPGFSVGNYGYVGTGYAAASYAVSFYKYDVCGVTLTVTPTAVSCNGGSNGSINLTVTGATNPLTYAWSNATTLEDPSGLSSGGYTVTVTDGAGCTNSTTVTVTQPAVLAGNITTITNASCYSLCNGKITGAHSGGTAPYTYSWAPSGGSSTSATGLCAGGYTVTITDSKGCTTIKDSLITQPTVLTATASATNATSACLCDGQTNATPAGGTTPYTYAWSPGGYTTSACTGLCGGINYTATITDSKGCTKKDTVSIVPSPLTVSLTATPATCSSCPNGDATAHQTGGTGPFTYLWTPTAQTTQIATGLSPRSYSVCVTDANSCSSCSSIYIGFAVGITEYYLENISVYPNPTSGKFTVSGLPSSVKEIEILNLIGETVYKTIVNKNSSAGAVPSGETINLSDMRDGIYFMRIKNQEGVLTKKILLNH